MARHESRDVIFDVPRHWEDKTLIAYASPTKPGQATAPNLVMTRDALGPSDTLQSYADRQLAELAKRLDAFELLGREDTSLGGHAAVVIHFSSKASGGPLEQRLAIAEGRRRSVYCFTLTTSKADAEQMNPLFERILSPVRFPRPSDGG